MTVGFLPPLLLALFAFGCGTFLEGAMTPAAALGFLALLAAVGLTGGDFRDALRLSGRAAWLPLLLALSVAASLVLSPVPRAGRAVALLLPAFYLLPGWVARLWRSAGGRLWGIRTTALVVGVISLWSLWEACRTDTRAALPLGHHNALALWLVTLLPFAVLCLRERGAFRTVGALCGVAGIAALAATGSVSAVVALALETLLAAGWLRSLGRRWRIGLLVPAGLLLLFLLPRLFAIIQGEDPSLQARTVYWQSALAGWLERPVFGWGPGAAPWTVALFLRPVPGVNPGDELVGQLHSLPLHLAFELGGAGAVLALAVAVLFARRRRRERAAAEDQGLLLAGLAGCAGFAVASLGQALLAVVALPVALALAVGAAIAGGAGGGGEAPPRLPRKMPVRVYALAAAVLLAPLELARWHYDRASRHAERGEADASRAALRAALRLDPSFPLYRMRYALAEPGTGEALRAARDGHGVGTLWLVSGALHGGSEATEEAWARACALMPMSALPPYFQALSSRDPAFAGRQMARAWLADPRLLAAAELRRRPELRQAALREVATEAGVDPGWREAFLAAAVRTQASPAGSFSRLALEIDLVPAESFSLHLFRRRPWPLLWPLVPLEEEALQQLDLPAASALPTTSPRVFDVLTCSVSTKQFKKTQK